MFSSLGMPHSRGTCISTVGDGASGSCVLRETAAGPKVVLEMKVCIETRAGYESLRSVPMVLPALAALF